MNKLQMDYIPNKGKEGPTKISSQFWKDFPPFEYKTLSTATVFKNELTSILALLLWTILAFFGLSKLSTNLKAI